MSKFWKIFGGFCLLSVIGFLAFSFLIAPNLIASKEKQVLKKLRNRGVELSYGKLDYSLSGVAFNKLHLLLSKKGVKLQCDFDRIEVEINLLSLASDVPKIDALLVEKGDCKINKAKKEKEKKNKKKPQKTQNPFADLELPKVIINDSLIRFKRHSLRITSLTIDPDGPVEGNLLVRALGEKYDIEVGGKVENQSRLFITLSPKNKKVFDINILGNTFKLGHVDIDLQPRKKQATLALNNLHIQRKGVAFKTQKISLKNAPDGSPSFELHGVDINLDTAPLRALLQHKNASGVELSSAPLVSPLALLDALEIGFSDLSLSLSHGEKRIRVIEKARGQWNKGELSFEGSVANGQLRANGIINPKAKTIYQLQAKLHDVRLGELPGMPSGRSLLPNRGTSGKLDGLLTASFRLRTPFKMGIDQTLDYALSLAWKDGVLDMEGVSENGLDKIELAIALKGKVNTSTFEVLNSGFLYAGPLVLSTQLNLSGWSKDLALTLQIEGEKKPCKDYFDAFPKSLWGPLSKASLSGEAELKLHINYFHSRPQETLLSIKGYKNCIVQSLASEQKLDVELPKKSDSKRDVDWLNKKFRKSVKEVDEGKKIVVGPGTTNYVNISALPKHVGGAAYLSEQVNFYTGKAINFALIQRALRRNLDEGRFVYGGSTITQQLVKNLFLSRDKTLSRKFQEMLIAWRIESVLTKDRILELYLNCIEFGPNLYGIGPAARHYFQKSATQLTPKESVFLAMLKPAPWRGLWYVNRGSTPTNPYFLERTDILLDRLFEKEIISQDTLDLEKRVRLTWKGGVYTRLLDPKPEDAALTPQESSPP